MERESKRDEEELELVPMEEPPAPAPPPEAPPPPEEPPEAPEPEPRGKEKPPEEEAAPAPPGMTRADALRILLWPLRGEAGQSLALAYLIYLICLLVATVVGWGLSALPYLGLWLGVIAHVVIACAGLAYLLEYTHHLVVATLRGNLEVQRIFAGGRPRDGLALLGLVAAYFAPAVILGLGTGSPAAGLLVAAAGFLLLPAAILLVAASGRVLAGNPFTAGRVAVAAGRSWLLLTLPFVVLAILRTYVPGGLAGLVVDALAGAILVYAALLAALLARQSAQVAAVLLGAGGTA